jgi:hypothetical protein
LLHEGGKKKKKKTLSIYAQKIIGCQFIYR